MTDGEDDVYDDGIWDAVDHWHQPRRRMPPVVATGWRASLSATALMTAVALGVQDVLEPKRDDPIIEEVDLDAWWPHDLAVVYHHVPGVPKASRAIVRPWLMR